jgi:hypothetical protein
MAESLGRAPDEEPIFELEELTGPEFDYHLLELLTHATPAITIEGHSRHRLVSVYGRHVDQETSVVTADCRDDERHRHRLTYTLDKDSPVSHEMLEDEPRNRD